MYTCHIVSYMTLNNISKTVAFHSQVPIECLSLEGCLYPDEDGVSYLKGENRLPFLQVKRMEIEKFNLMSEEEMERILAYARQSEIIKKLVYVVESEIFTLLIP